MHSNDICNCFFGGFDIKQHSDLQASPTSSAIFSKHIVLLKLKKSRKNASTMHLKNPGFQVWMCCFHPSSYFQKKKNFVQKEMPLFSASNQCCWEPHAKIAPLKLIWSGLMTSHPSVAHRVWCCSLGSWEVKKSGYGSFDFGFVDLVLFLGWAKFGNGDE